MEADWPTGQSPEWGSQLWVLFGDFWATRKYRYLNIDSKF